METLTVRELIDSRDWEEIEEPQQTNKKYYVHFESHSNANNKYEEFARALLSTMDRDIKTEEEMLSEVELYKKILDEEHKKNFKKCKDINVYFFDNFKDDYTLTIGICCVRFYLINEKK